MLDTESFLLGIATGGGGDGGNPNYVETIEGTLRNPWGQSDELKPSFVTTLVEEIKSLDVTAFLWVGGSIDARVPILPNKWDPTTEYIIASVVLVRPDVKEQQGGCCIYTVDGALRSAFVLAPDKEYAWEDITSAASQIPTTLTIIHHPMP